ncbi:MAG: BamA/TamA family outer membrane protein [bacterium]|nr:BamA/TamA family outer membrane protein [bacterium]
MRYTDRILLILCTILLGLVAHSHARLLPYFTIPDQNRNYNAVGKQIYAITWQGLHYTKPYIVERELSFVQAGSRLDSTSLQNMKERLQGLDIFASVEAVTEIDNDKVAIRWEVKELPPVLVYPAVGTDSRGNAQYGGGIFSLNLGGRDIEAIGTAMFGKTKNYDFVIRSPWIGWNHFSSEFSSSFSERDNPLEQFYEKTWSHSLWFGSWIGEVGRVGVGAGWFEMDADSVRSTISHTGYDKQQWFGARAAIDRRDRTTRTMAGWWGETEFRNYIGDGEFAEGLLDARWWVPILGNVYFYQSDWMRVRNRTPETGLPRYYLLHVGGTNSVRGYSNSDLSTGSYGSNEYIVTSEIRWRVLPKVVGHGLGMAIPFGVELAGFTDIGAAWTKRITETRRSIGGGFGLRFLVPSFQEVRFDFGIGEGGNHEVAFGLNTKMYWQSLRVR